jgi:aminoglycoside phosphotransferase (APT) family kinase protein
MPADPRVRPLVELDAAAIAAMLAPLLGGAAPREVARVDGGLTNTLYRVVAPDGAAYALRVHAAGDAARAAAGDATAFERERRLLARLAGPLPPLPVPEVLLADDDACGAPAWLAYRWIDGVTLNDCRRRVPPAELLALAGPLGALLARLAAALAADSLGPPPLAPPAAAALRVADALARADDALRAGPARHRLGPALADALRERLGAAAPRLEALDRPAVLVHGDFGGRNVIVRDAGGGRWAPAGVLDGESAAVGSRLWDVGSLFRYPRRYGDEFRAAFARGYRAAGGALPADWWDAARLLDATRLVDTLGAPRELPTVFAECRELVAALVAGDAPVPLASLPR